MKALTLSQPWATLVAISAKRIETREDVRRQISLHPVGSGKTMAEAVCRAALKAVHDWFRYEDKQ